MGISKICLEFSRITKSKNTSICQKFEIIHLLNSVFTWTPENWRYPPFKSAVSLTFSEWTLHSKTSRNVFPVTEIFWRVLLNGITDIRSLMVICWMKKNNYVTLIKRKSDENVGRKKNRFVCEKSDKNYDEKFCKIDCPSLEVVLHAHVNGMYKFRKWWWI